MGLVETEAVVLRVYRLADADKIVLALTAEAGVVRGVARGARRLKSRFGAALEPYTLTALQYFEKENRELVSISGAEIVRSYFDLVKSQKVYDALQYIGEMTVEFTPPREPNPLMFRMLKACLEAIAEQPERAFAVVRYFEVWLLRLAGLLPDSKLCGNCGNVLAANEPAFYRIGEAVRCQFCATAAGRELSKTLRNQLSLAQKLSPAQFARELDDKAAPEIESFAKPLILRALEREHLNQSATQLKQIVASDKVRTATTLDR